MYYNIKNIDKLVSEMKLFKEKYNISKFEFIDEAISPAYMEEMSKRFIEEKLDITFFTFALILKTLKTLLLYNWLKSHFIL